MSYQIKLKQYQQRINKGNKNGYKILNTAKYLSSGIIQNYLIYLSTKKICTFFTNTSKVLSWKSKWLSEESTRNITASDSHFAPTFINYYPLPDIKFNGQYLVKNINTS